MNDFDPTAFSASSGPVPVPASDQPAQPPMPEPADVPEGFCDRPECFPIGFDGTTGLASFATRTPAQLADRGEPVDDAEPVLEFPVASVARSMVDASMGPRSCGLVAGTPDAPVPALVKAMARCAPAEVRDRPRVIRQLANLRRRVPNNRNAVANWLFAAHSLHRLVVRTDDPDRRALVSMPEDAGNITPDLLGASRESKALLIHQPIEHSISGTFADRTRRNELVGLGARAMVDLRGMQLMPNVNPSMLSDPCRAAFAWATSMWFVHILTQRLADRVRTIAWSDVMERPEDTLRAGVEFMGWAFDESGLDEAVSILREADPTDRQRELAEANPAETEEARRLIDLAYKRRPMPSSVGAGLLG